MIKTTRAYEPASGVDRTHFLVERLWPRGVSKATLHIETWLKGVAPSIELRQWFNHHPENWNEFRRRYRRELDESERRGSRLWPPLVAGTILSSTMPRYGAQQSRVAGIS
jgi:uncharacterized protein YeaO (DUF488 family)